MKLRQFKKFIAFALACITIAGSTPAVDVHAEDTSNSKVDIYATQSSDYLITIPKQLILDGKSGTGAYRVSVKGNISGTDIITVTPDERFFMKQEGKTDILTTIEQIKTQFTYADGVRPEVEVTADGKVQMEKISAGKWTGLFNFNITSSVDLESEDSVGSTIDDIKGNGTGKDTAQNKYSEYITTGAIVDIPVSAKNEKGEDINATSSNIVGSKAEDLLDSLKEAGYIEDTEEVDALIEVNSDDFEGLAETTFDVSNIAQEGDTVVILHYDEEKQMWEHISTETVDENGTVTGDFTSYSPVAFVKVDKNGNIETHLHSFVISIKDSTCTEDGLKTYTCECDYVETEVINKLGHNHIPTIIPVKCTEDGYTLHVCTRCDDEYKDTWVDATGHTVVKVGTSEIHEKCSTCGITLSDKHELKETIIAEGNCVTTGIKKYTCECGYSYEETVVANGHNYGDYEVTTPATCTADGIKTKTCSLCGNKETAVITKLGHNYSTSYTVDKEATCTTAGSKSQHCSRCTSTQNVTSIPATGHTSVNGGTSSIHTKCSVCGTTLTTAHSYTSSVQTPATCTTKGTTKYTCSCGYVTTAQDIAINSSNHTGSVVNGGTSGVHTKYNCCGATVSSTHSYTVDSGIQYTAATCTSARYNYKKCSCGYNPKSASYVVATGSAKGHSYGSYTTSTTQHWQTCTNGCGTITTKTNHYDGGTDGKCDTCGYKGTIVYTYHTHSGSASSGTGCYTGSLQEVVTGYENSHAFSSSTVTWYHETSGGCSEGHSANVNTCSAYEYSCYYCDRHSVVTLTPLVNTWWCGCTFSYCESSTTWYGSDSCVSRPVTSYVYSLGCGKTTSTVISQKTEFK